MKHKKVFSFAFLFYIIENLALDFPSSSASSYKSPYSIETLLKLKPSVCPRPQNLPYIKEITEDTDTVKGDYETMVRHSKRNSYADHGKRGSNFKGNTPDHRRTSTVTGRGMRTPSVSTPSVNLNLPQLTKAAFKWRRGLVNSDILGESGKKIKGILNRLNGKNFEILSKVFLFFSLYASLGNDGSRKGKCYKRRSVG